MRAVVEDRREILVATAGTSVHASLDETITAEVDSLFAVNVRPPFFLIQQLLPIFSEGSSIETDYFVNA